MTEPRELETDEDVLELWREWAWDEDRWSLMVPAVIQLVASNIRTVRGRRRRIAEIAQRKMSQHCGSR